MKLVTAAKENDHILPINDAMFYRSVTGLESCVYDWFENFTPQVITNNEIRIRPGCGVIQGRIFETEPGTYDSVTITNGTQGEKRIDLIVARYEADATTETQDADWAVIQGTPTTGTPAAPSYTAGDIDAGDAVAEMPMFEVELDGINVVEVRTRFEVAQTLEDSRISAETIAMYESLGFDPANYPGGAVVSKLLEFVAGLLGDGSALADGYIEFPNGLKACWGATAAGPSGSETVLPISFANPLLVCTPRYNYSTTARCITTGGVVGNKMSISYFDTVTNAFSTQNNLTANYFIIGY